MQPIPYLGEMIRDDWIYEPKIDGWRMQIIRQPDGNIEIWGRRLERKPDWTDKLSYLIGMIESFCPKGSILDCELSSTKGRRFIPSLFARNRKAEPIIWIFDTIYYDNFFVGDRPLSERKRLISNLSIRKPFYLVAEEELSDIELALNRAIRDGHEGVVIKRLHSKYQVGSDGPIATQDWRKLKP